MEDSTGQTRRRRVRPLASILTYDPKRDVWLTYSHMKVPRWSHSVSAVTVTGALMEQCRQSRTPRDDSLYGNYTDTGRHFTGRLTFYIRYFDHGRLPRNTQQDS